MDGRRSRSLRQRLRHVCWLGGGSGAGKSTVARLVAERHGLLVYATDDVMAEHARRSTADDAPLLARFARMDMDERWVNRSPADMADTFHWFSGEGFDLVVEDLLALPADVGVVAEGFRLLPHLVAPLLGAPGRACWLLPTPAFREAAFDSRGTAWDIPSRTSDPSRARRNLLERDRLFTDRLRAETSRLGLPAIEVMTAMGQDELAARVMTTFGL